MPIKKGSEKIIEKLNEIENADWMYDRSWQPKFVYHFTDILNAVNILKCGVLYSRNNAIHKELMQNDNASSEIINKTKLEKKDYVRLYFRPKTPTQFQNEGFVPIGGQYQGSHCPIPIMFLFKSAPILLDEKVQFSDGNIASPNAKIGDSVEFYLSLEFEDIYHNSSLPLNDEHRKSEIKYHRQAEVLIKDELSLDNLSWIFCRSEAESETLKNILPDEIWRKWNKKIWIDRRNWVFFHKRPYVKKVNMDINSVSFLFNIDRQSEAGPFNIKIDITNFETNDIYTWQENNHFCEELPLLMDISGIKNLNNYSVELSIDDHIAYKNTFIEEDILF